MARVQVLVQLDDRQVSALDVHADAAGDSRSVLIRRAIDLYLAALDEAVEDVRYAEAYGDLPEDLAGSAALRELALQTWPDR